MPDPLRLVSLGLLLAPSAAAMLPTPVARARSAHPRPRDQGGRLEPKDTRLVSAGQGVVQGTGAGAPLDPAGSGQTRNALPAPRSMAISLWFSAHGGLGPLGGRGLASGRPGDQDGSRVSGLPPLLPPLSLSPTFTRPPVLARPFTPLPAQALGQGRPGTGTMGVAETRNTPTLTRTRPSTALTRTPFSLQVALGSPPPESTPSVRATVQAHTGSRRDSSRSLADLDDLDPGADSDAERKSAPPDQEEGFVPGDEVLVLLAPGRDHGGPVRMIPAVLAPSGEGGVGTALVTNRFPHPVKLTRAGLLRHAGLHRMPDKPGRSEAKGPMADSETLEAGESVRLRPDPFDGEMIFRVTDLKGNLKACLVLSTGTFSP